VLAVLGKILELVTRLRMIYTTTGTRCSAMIFCAVAKAGTISSGSCTRNALQPSPSTTRTWSTP